MSKPGETTKLLGSSPDTKKFYFLQQRQNSKVEEGEEGKSIEMPTNPIPIQMPQVTVNNHENHAIESVVEEDMSIHPAPRSWFFGIFGSSTNNAYQPVGNLPRKVPVKIEPKVFFANERTFLAWLHMSVTLASISMAIIAFAEANALSKMYGLLLMPVAIAFCVYSLWMYMKRAGMIRRKEPGPYEDKVGPIALASLLAISITVNFFVKIYDLAT